MHLQITANITTADMCTDNVNCIWKVHSINIIVDIHLNILVMIMKITYAYTLGIKIFTQLVQLCSEQKISLSIISLPPPLHLQRGGQEYSEGGLRKSMRGDKEMLKGG